MTRQELINFVKTLVNEISPTNGLPIPIDGFADDRPIDDMIDQLLDPATRAVLQKCPPSKAPSTNLPLAEAHLEADGSALIIKPADYIRLLGVRLSGWQRSVGHAVAAHSSLAQQQGNSYLRAGNAKPVVVDVGTHLQLWPAQATHLVGATATYVAFTSPEMLGLSLQTAIGWQTAALYLQIVDQTSAAQQAETRVQQYLLDFD